MPTKIVEVVNQKLEDFKEEVISRLQRIENKLDNVEGQTRKTNGRVNLLESNEASCPARKYFVDITTKKDWTMVWVGFGSGIGGAVIIMIINYILFNKP